MNTPRNLSARNLRLAFLPALVLAFPALPDHAGLRVRGSITPLIAIPRPGPVIPPEIAPAYLDNLSDQTVYGMKTFIQPVQGDLIGTAAEAILFTGPLSGDVQGTQSATRVTRVSLDALPSIGFGPTFAAAKVKYVNTDADPADPRMDGSIAHPYYSLATAANGAHDGDHFFLTGSFYGAFVFSRAVTVQGSSPDQTTVYGTMVFSGFLASHLRDVRVNCTADAACVSNRSTRGSDLVMHRVTINQSGAGPAAEAQTGRLIAAHADINHFGSGPVVSLAAPVSAASRFDDCRLSGTVNAQGLRITSGGAAITGGSISVSGGQPAVAVNGGDAWITGASLSSGAVPLSLIDGGRVTVRDSTLTAGAGFSAVRITAGAGAQPVFLNNLYITDVGIAAVECLSAASLVSGGNASRNNLAATPAQQFSGACSVTAPAAF